MSSEPKGPRLILPTAADPHEKVWLVDEHDNELGWKWREDLGEDDCWRIVTIWVENSQGQVLMQQRSLSKRLSPGVWTQAVAGTVVYGDEYLATAEREVTEELGLTGHPLIRTGHLYDHSEIGWRQAEAYKIVCDWPLEQFIFPVTEIEQLAWLPRDEVLREISGRQPPSRAYGLSHRLWPELFDLS